MGKAPRPGFLTLLSAAMFAAPLLLAVACCLVPFGSMIAEPKAAASFVEMAILGGIGSTIHGALFVVEYRAIRGRSAGAAASVASLCFGLAALGTIGWAEGFLRLVGLLRRDHDWRSWWDLVLCSAFLACLVFIGTAHRKWCRTLRAAEALETRAWDA